jgi:hypothetical protein
MTYVFTQRGFLDRETQGEYHVKMKREIRMVNLQRLPANQGKAGERPGTESPFVALRMNQLCCLNLGLLVSRAGKQHIPVI